MNEQTREMITLIIAILGFAMSLLQWIYTIYNSRTNFSMSIERFEWHRSSEYDRAIFTFMIWNSSSQPLTITRMTTQNVNCLISHQWIGEKYYPKFPECDIPCTERRLSPDFPITLVPNGGGIYSVIFDFEKDSVTWDRFVNIKVQTTNKAKSFTLYCPPHSNNQLYL